MRFTTLKYWSDPLDFAGYTTSGNCQIYFLDFREDNFMQHSLNLTYISSLQSLDYRITFRKDFENINAEELLMYAKVVFDVDIDEELFIETVNQYKTTMSEMGTNTMDEKMFYEKDNIMIKISRFNYEGELYLAFKGLYEKAD